MTFIVGDLRHYVRIEQQVTSVDTEGLQDQAWVLYAERWAQIADLSVRDLLTAQQVQSEVTTRITLWFDAAINATMRILHGSFVYNVRGVQRDVDSGREYITLMCARGLNQG